MYMIFKCSHLQLLHMCCKMQEHAMLWTLVHAHGTSMWANCMVYCKTN